MAQAVTQAFIDEWSRHAGKVRVEEVQYKRRFFNGTAFVYEANFTTLPHSSFVEIQDIKVDFDSKFQNSMRISEVSIKVPNLRGEWFDNDTAPSIFAIDDIALLGYDPVRMQVRARFGLKVNGVDVFFDMFTGILRNIQYNSDEGTATFIVASNAEKLRNSDATQVKGLDFTGIESPDSPGDGTNKAFNTVVTGIAYVDSVEQIDGFVITAGVNDKMVWEDGFSSGRTVTLTAGTFKAGQTSAEAGTMCANIADAMTALIGVYTVSYSFITKKFTIVQVTDPAGIPTFNIEWSFDATTQALAATLGYDATDDTGATSYTSDNPTSSTVLGQDSFSVSNRAKLIVATATLDVAPNLGVTILLTGRTWKINQSPDDLVADLATEAGIPPSERTLNPIIFPGGLSASVSIDSTADWEDNTLEDNVDTEAVDGGIKGPWIVLDNFNDGDNDGWLIPSLGGPDDWFVVNGKMTNSISGVLQRRTITKSDSRLVSVGMWAADIDVQSMAGTSGSVKWQFITVATFPTALPAGYAIRATEDGIIRLVRVEGGGAHTSLLSLGATPSGETTWRVRRNASGVFRVWKDGALIGTVTDTTFNTNLSMYVELEANIGTTTFTIDNIVFAPILDSGDDDNITMDFRSSEFDLAGTPTSFGLLDRIVIPFGTIRYFTAVASVSGGPFDAFVEIAGNGQILSALKQFVKIRVTVTLSDLDDLVSVPEIQKLTLNFVTTEVQIAVANHEGKSCLDAIEDYVKLADYEMVFDGSGNFIVRSKIVSGGGVFTLTDSTSIIRLSNFDPGYTRVQNAFRVKRDEFLAEFDGAIAGEASPTSEERFGRILFFEDQTGVLVRNDVNIALGRAQALYESRFRPKRRIRCVAKIAPWLELSDIITLTYFETPLQRGMVLGDPLFIMSRFRHWATGGIPDNVYLRSVDFKIIGVSWIFRKMMMDLILEEVLP